MLGSINQSIDSSYLPITWIYLPRYKTEVPVLFLRRFAFSSSPVISILLTSTHNYLLHKQGPTTLTVLATMTSSILSLHGGGMDQTRTSITVLVLGDGEEKRMRLMIHSMFEKSFQKNDEKLCFLLGSWGLFCFVLDSISLVEVVRGWSLILRERIPSSRGRRLLQTFTCGFSNFRKFPLALLHRTREDLSM